MQALDGVFHKQEGEARNKEITERGISEMEPARERTEQIRGEHAHSHGAGSGKGAGSHFAKERAFEGQRLQLPGQESGVDHKIALSAARKASTEHHNRHV